MLRHCGLAITGLVCLLSGVTLSSAQAPPPTPPTTSPPPSLPPVGAPPMRMPPNVQLEQIPMDFTHSPRA
jgi:hypothetical protein